MEPMMTSPTSAPSRPEEHGDGHNHEEHATRRPVPAFTLTELIIVVAVIALLAGILLPVIIGAQRRSRQMRIQADLQSIVLALDVYKSDFGDIPRLPVDPNTGKPIPDTGAATLGKALLGPLGDGRSATGVASDDPPLFNSGTDYKAGQCVSTGGGQLYVAIRDNTGQNVTNTDYWAPFNPRDGADGPGFRTRLGIDSDGDGIPDTPDPTGKVWGPYLQPDAFKTHKYGCAILDREGHPILYFPTRPGNQNIRVSTPLPDGAFAYTDRSELSYINASNNIQVFRRDGEPNTNNALLRIRLMLGDTNTNGYIDSDEKPIASPFILYSAGVGGRGDPAGWYGPANYVIPTSPTPQQVEQNRKAAEDCDDIIVTK